MKKPVQLIVILLGILLLGGCASVDTTSLPKVSRTDPNEPGKNTSNQHKTIDLTPLTDFNNLHKENTAQGNLIANTYTRILITGEGYEKSGAESELDYNNRSWLARYFWAKKYDLNLSARILIGCYETTVPLVTISHNSGREGEQWLRTVNHQFLSSPLFLVKEDGSMSVPSIHFKLSASNEYTSNMAGSALQVAITAIRQISPEAKILTTLTEQSSKDTARAIDEAIGKLFGSSIMEEHIYDQALRKWQSEGGVSISLYIPKQEGNFSDASKCNVGKWIVNFDEPRPSIFSDWRLCGVAKEGIRCKKNKNEALKAIYKEISPGQVLSYELMKAGAKSITIRSYITQQEWYISALSSFSNKIATDKEIAETICRNIVNSITDLGLNSEDADIVVWAAINGLPKAKNMYQNAYKNAETCSRVLNKIK